MKHFSRWFFASASVIIIVITLVVALTPRDSSVPREPLSHPDISRMDIFLAGISLSDLNNGAKHDIHGGNTVEITTSTGSSYSFASTEIRLRGNSTFGWDKKPYQLKFPSRTSLFGLGSSRTWVLLAHQYDPTHLRTYLSSEISQALEISPTPEGEYLELYIDGTYLGLYYLTPKVNMARLSLSDPTALMVEIDDVHYRDATYIEKDCFGHLLTLADSNTSVPEENQRLLEDFRDKFTLAERYLESGDYIGASDLLDIESFAQYFLISEITSNGDAYGTSCYFYEEDYADVIHAGPVWDFDLAYGNYSFATEENHVNSPTYLRFDNPDYDTTNIYTLLYSFPEFREVVADIYDSRIRGRALDFLARIDTEASLLLPYAEQNNVKWYGDDYLPYTEHVSALKSWLKDRLDFLDTFLWYN